MNNQQAFHENARLFAVLERCKAIFVNSDGSFHLTSRGVKVVQLMKDNPEIGLMHQQMIADGASARVADLALLVAAAQGVLNEDEFHQLDGGNQP